MDIVQTHSMAISTHKRTHRQHHWPYLICLESRLSAGYVCQQQHVPKAKKMAISAEVAKGQTINIPQSHICEADVETPCCG